MVIELVSLIQTNISKGVAICARQKRDSLLSASHGQLPRGWHQIRRHWSYENYHVCSDFNPTQMVAIIKCTASDHFFPLIIIIQCYFPALRWLRSFILQLLAGPAVTSHICTGPKSSDSLHWRKTTKDPKHQNAFTLPPQTTTWNVLLPEGQGRDGQHGLQLGEWPGWWWWLMLGIKMIVMIQVMNEDDDDCGDLLV